jgi:hypothetical protein
MVKRKFVGFRAESKLYEELKKQSQKSDMSVSHFIRTNIKKLMKDNKGSVADMVMIMVIIFMVAMSGLIGLTVLSSFNTALANTTMGNNSLVMNVTTDVQNTYGVLDSSFPLLFIGANMVVLFLSYMARSHPILMIFIIFLLVFMVLFAAILSDTYYALSINAQLHTAATQMTMTQYVMNNLPLFQLIFGFVDMIVMISLVGKGGE